MENGYRRKPNILLKFYTLLCPLNIKIIPLEHWKICSAVTEHLVSSTVSLSQVFEAQGNQTHTNSSTSPIYHDLDLQGYFLPISIRLLTLEDILIPEHFISISSPFPFSPLFCTWKLLTYFLSTDLPIIDTLYKQYHTICSLLWLASFI